LRPLVVPASDREDPAVAVLLQPQALMQAPEHIEQQLQEGAIKARAVSAPFIKELRKAVGISRISL
jgi:hypothetical protein